MIPAKENVNPIYSVGKWDSQKGGQEHPLIMYLNKNIGIFWDPYTKRVD